MKDMMMKKKDSMKDLDMEAKKASIMELLDLAKDMMKQGVSSEMDEMQKVTVAAPDKDKLLMGLEKAEDLVAQGPEMSDMEDESEDYEEEEDEEDLA
jgi:hypothetical protein